MIPIAIHDALQNAATRSGWRLRDENESDVEFLCQLYATLRGIEPTVAGWPEALKSAFLQQQFAAQRRHYLSHYREHGSFLIVESLRPPEQPESPTPIGRLYLSLLDDEVRVVDISLLPAFQARGGGTEMLNSLIDAAGRHGYRVGLHVEQSNRAQGLYRRLGFRDCHADGPYLFMQWQAAPATHWQGSAAARAQNCVRD